MLIDLLLWKFVGLSLRTASNVVLFAASCWLAGFFHSMPFEFLLYDDNENMDYYDLRVHIMTRVKITWHGVFAFIIAIII